MRARNFAILWFAGIVSNAGTQMQSVAKVWLIVQRTDSALALAVSGLCFALPMTLLPPIGGVLADRVDRVTILKCTQASQVIQPLVVASLLATGHAPLWLLYADTVVSATVNAFNSPAQQALLPALVPPADLLSATSLQAMVFTGAQLVGPALGGVLLILLDAAWLFAFNGFTTLAVLAALMTLRDVPGREPVPKDALGTRDNGFRYAWEYRPVRAILALTAGLTLLTGAYRILLPFFARDIWHVGTWGYGLLSSAPGAGVLIGTFGLVACGDLRRKVPVASGGVVLFCGAVLVFAHVPTFALGLTLLVLVGLTSAVANALLATLLQLLVPGYIRGRIMALRAIAFIGLGDFGGLLAGGLAQLTGAAMALTCAAIALLVTTPFATRLVGAATGHAAQETESAVASASPIDRRE